MKLVGLTLDRLNDPRGETKAQHETIKQEPAYQQQLEAQQQALLETAQQLQVLERQLTEYAELDKRIFEKEAALHQRHKIGRAHV